MTNLQILNGCTCLVQYVHLSCPFPLCSCMDCVYNPFSWPSIYSPFTVFTALNDIRYHAIYKNKRK